LRPKTYKIVVNTRQKTKIALAFIAMQKHQMSCRFHATAAKNIQA